VPGLFDHVLIPSAPAGGNYSLSNSGMDISVIAITVEPFAQWALPSGIRTDGVGY